MDSMPRVTRRATAEWFAPGDFERVEHAVASALAEHGGHVDGLDADYGASAAFRLLGIIVPGEEHRVPVHAHVDLRPGPDAHSIQVRLEMRSIEGMYLLEFADAHQADAAYSEKFAEIEASCKNATGVIG
jgi:hypothetical protein